MNSVSVSRVVPIRPSVDGYLPLIEALLFAADRPLTPEQLATPAGCTPEIAQRTIEALERKLALSYHGICVVWSGGAAQLVPKPQYCQAIAAARRMDTDRATTVISEYLHVQQLKGRRPGTIKGYGDFLTRFAREVAKPIEEIQPRDIRMFMMGEERQRGNCRNTLSTKTAYLRSFFDWCEREDLVDKNPMRKIDKPKEDKPAPKHLTHDELELVREACRKPFEKMLLELLYSSGLRVFEAVALDWSDIDWQERSIKVRDGKGGKERVAPMSTRATILLRRYKEERKDSELYVLRSQFNQRMSTASVRRWLRKLGERAGLKRRLSPHCLRHSLATHLLAGGVPIEIVQAILGHSDLKTTQIYAKTQRTAVEMHYRRVIA